MCFHRRNRSAFSLVQLLAVIFLLGILFLIMMPAAQKTRVTVRRTDCNHYLRQLALSALNYESARQTLPPGVTDEDDDLTDAMHTGFLQLLPFLELNTLYEQFDQSESWKSDNNMKYSTTPLFQFLCPSNRDGRVAKSDDGGFAGAVSDYAFCKGASGYLGLDTQFQNGAFDVNSETRIGHFSDGTANTILFGEAASHPSLRTGENGRYGLGQLWAKADFDGDHGFGNEGGRGSCLAVTGQHAGPDNEWGTDDDLITPIGRNPSELSVDNGGDGTFENATDRVRGFYSFHEGYINFAYGDGSTHTIPTSVDPLVMILLSVRNDGKEIEVQEF